jgi:hypothetical protein
MQHCDRRKTASNQGDERMRIDTGREFGEGRPVQSALAEACALALTLIRRMRGHSASDREEIHET